MDDDPEIRLAVLDSLGINNELLQTAMNDNDVHIREKAENLLKPDK